MDTRKKRKYSSKQRRQAEHIEEGYEKRGMPKKWAWSVAWATVRKHSREKGGRPHCG